MLIRYRRWVLFLPALSLIVAVNCAQAQCQSSVPRELNLYQSYCVRVCPDSDYVFSLSSPHADPEMFPHLFTSPGCNGRGGAECQGDCMPIEPPAWPWAQGQAPQFGQDPLQPDAIFIENDCMEMYVYWSHNGYWVLEILMNDCSGCFCLWFDWQMPVKLASLNAVAGDSKVTLNWNTTSESSNDHFEIVRDDRRIVASVRTLGNGSAGHQYTWSDNDVVNDRTYTYHLRSVDYNGQTNELRVIGATPNFAPAAIKDYALYQNYPNPFNPSTRIMFDVPVAGLVKLNVYNPVGEHFTSLINGHLSAGRYAVNFDGTDLSSGLYFFTVQIADKFSATRKMLLVK